MPYTTMPDTSSSSSSTANSSINNSSNSKWCSHCQTTHLTISTTTTVAVNTTIQLHQRGRQLDEDMLNDDDATHQFDDPLSSDLFASPDDHPDRPDDQPHNENGAPAASTDDAERRRSATRGGARTQIRASSTTATSQQRRAMGRMFTMLVALMVALMLIDANVSAETYTMLDARHREIRAVAVPDDSNPIGTTDMMGRK